MLLKLTTMQAGTSGRDTMRTMRNNPNLYELFSQGMWGGGGNGVSSLLRPSPSLGAQAPHGENPGKNIRAS